ncbi:CLUMA_CG005364, isoform A [Clunio marinus]|uniref:CLUMA_CG005364, isoform A n=1 Tax=Clunio marinus TaxID=568069 RepID=A0A1J1I020_9DIPT|nr:CLUMA_CG005364, isoform A [Clunio marinus]
MEFLLILSMILPAALANSESEKWSWPTSPNDRNRADNRKDIYYENSSNRDGKAERIRVPTSYDNERPIEAYQVKRPAVNRPKPLSDEFSDEFTSSGENYANNVNGQNNNRYPSVNTPNRFGPQQSNDFPQPFGYGQQPFPGAGGFLGGGVGGPFGAQGYPHPGQFQGGHHPGGLGNHISNGILVGPGGPTGIVGRPYGKRYPPYYGGGYPGGGIGYGSHGGLGFEGHHNGIGGPGIGGQFGGHQQPFPGGPHGHGGQFGGQQPFIQGPGQGYPGQFGGGPYSPNFGGPIPFPGQFFDSTSQTKKVEKSAK